MSYYSKSEMHRINMMSEAQLIDCGYSQESAKKQAIFNSIYISIYEGHKKLQELYGKKNFELDIEVNYNHWNDEVNIMDMAVTTTSFEKYPEEFLKWANYVGISDEGDL